MEESFLLKHHGNISFVEQVYMIAEDRQWWIKRLQKEFDKQSQAASGSSTPSHTPGQPQF